MGHLWCGFFFFPFICSLNIRQQVETDPLKDIMFSAAIGCRILTKNTDFLWAQRYCHFSDWLNVAAYFQNTQRCDNHKCVINELFWPYLLQKLPEPWLENILILVWAKCTPTCSIFLLGYMMWMFLRIACVLFPARTVAQIHSLLSREGMLFKRFGVRSAQ